MAQRSVLEANVRRKMIDEDATAYINTIPTYLQQAQIDLEEMCLFRQQVAEFSVSTQLGNPFVGVEPVDFIRVRPLVKDVEGPYWVDGHGRANNMQLFESPQEGLVVYGRDPAASAYGPPKALSLGDPDFFNVMRVFPVPDELSPVGNYRSLRTYEVRLPYWKRLTSLTSASSANFFTTDRRSQQYLENQAAALALFEMRYTDSAAAYFSLAADLVADIRAQRSRDKVDKEATNRLDRSYGWSRHTRRRRR